MFMLNGTFSRLLMLALSLATSFLGCTASKQPDFEALHPVSGKVQRAGQPLAGGVVRFNSVPDKPEFSINGLVNDEGAFSLTTVRSTDTRGERRPGAPVGEFSVVYTPPNLDQTKIFEPPITLPMLVKIEAQDNNLTLEVPK